jgi:hypothetical protein
MSATIPTETAERYREMAKECRQGSAESWERSDTDGFMSQWASDTMAREYDMLASLVEDGGMIETRALFTLDGKIASVEEREGQFGAYWVLNHEAARAYGKKFFNESNAGTAAKRAANNAKKGFVFGIIRVRGLVEMVGGRCYTSVRPVYSPVWEDLRDGKFEIVTTNNPED